MGCDGQLTGIKQDDL